jgi:hypothetical protein
MPGERGKTARLARILLIHLVMLQFKCHIGAFMAQTMPCPIKNK